MKKIINLGIFAHVDAGKTTLTENMLFHAGKIRSLGSVDKGSSHTDFLDVEKKRGITVRSTATYFDWQGVQINLIDTPGHMDFSAEVERSLSAIDCAILVLSAVEGIQSQTEIIWDALREMNIPTILYINKIDRMGADSQTLIDSIKKEFSSSIVPMNFAVDEGESNASIQDNVLLEDESSIELIAERDDDLLEKYLNGETISSDELNASMRISTQNCKAFPLLSGVAKNNIGVVEAMDSIAKYFPFANNDLTSPPSGIVFSISHRKRDGTIAGVRLFSGKISNRDIIKNHSQSIDIKISQIKKSFGNKFEDIGVLEAGDVGFLTGMHNVAVGDILGDPEFVPNMSSFTEPLLSVQAIARNPADYTKLADALQQLNQEDPLLDFKWFKEDKELVLKIMGAVQTEILEEILLSRFGIVTSLSQPNIIYKETPKSIGYGIERYTMPKPCWAVLKLKIEQGERGSGVVYRSELSTDKIHRKYQNEIEMTIPKALKQGIKGWEVTDLKITLVDGEDHVVHSNPGDFKLATPMAVMNGLVLTDTVLLEPILNYRITAPEEFIGKVTGDIINMRGTMEPAEMDNGNFVLRGAYPLAEAMDYSIRLASLTSGKAKLSQKFSCYEVCPTGMGVEREFKGISPLDRSKYILKMRGAITEK
jgi:ribosomal protection tetracycline resistance protein